MSRPAVIDATAPPARLAAFRLLTGVFVVGYLLLRLPVFAELARRPPTTFEAVGVLAPLGDPLPSIVVDALIGVSLLSGVAYTVGWRFRATGPIFAASLLVLTTYRGSWGQLLHFENLIVLHVVIVGLAPAADAWSVDARRRSRLGGTPRRRDPTAYGWPLALASLTLVLTYLIAGVAKLRYGGPEWVVGDTLRNHVAYSAGRLELLGGNPSPLASRVVGHAWAFVPLAAGAVAVECAAPIALFGGRLRTAWVVAAWTMHAGILALMLVGFPYPLFLVAFAPLFRLERLGDLGRLRQWRSAPAVAVAEPA